MIVNEQEAVSRAMYWELKRKAPPDVPVYQQGPLQNDVWEALDGDKDDFLVYDRCGLLTFHIVLPYSFLHYPYVEAAIRATYFKNICNCTAHSNHTSSGSSFLMKNETSALNQTTPVTSAPAEETDQPPPRLHVHQHRPRHHHPHHHPPHTHHHNHPDTHRHDTNQTQPPHHK